MVVVTPTELFERRRSDGAVMMLSTTCEGVCFVTKEKRIEKICSYYVVQISNKMCTLEHCCGMPQVRSGVGQEPTPMS